MKDRIETTNKKILLIYNYDKKVERFYKNYKKTLINKYGKVTTNQSEAQEVIIANF